MQLANVDNIKRFLETLPEYELKEITINGTVAKKFKAVCYKNTNYPIAIVSNKYKLAQHKTVFTIALERVLKKFKEEEVKGWVQHTKTKAYLFLTFREVEVKEDSIYKMGLIVTNSVNTQLSIWTNLFTFREVCSNGIIQKTPLLEVQNKHIGTSDFWARFKERFDRVLEVFDNEYQREIKFIMELKDYTLSPIEILKHLDTSKKAFVEITKQLKSIDTLFNIYQAITNYYTNTKSMNIANRVNYIRKARDIIEKYVKQAQGVGYYE